MLFRSMVAATLALYATLVSAGGRPRISKTPDDSSPEESPDMCTFDILTTLVGEECFDLEDALPGTTVFGPCDFAFEEFLDSLDFVPDDLCQDVLDGELEEAVEAEIVEILTYHVVADEITGDDLFKADGILMIETLQGQNVAVNADDLTVNDINIIEPDVLDDPYILHGIAGVLIPPGEGGNGGGKNGGGKTGGTGSTGKSGTSTGKNGNGGGGNGKNGSDYDYSSDRGDGKSGNGNGGSASKASGNGNGDGGSSGKAGNGGSASKASGNGNGDGGSSGKAGNGGSASKASGNGNGDGGSSGKAGNGGSASKASGNGNGDSTGKSSGKASGYDDY